MSRWSYELIKGRNVIPNLQDFFTVGLTTPVLDLKQSYMLDMASKQDGITTLHFHRPRITSDSEDIQFNVSWRLSKLTHAGSRFLATVSSRALRNHLRLFQKL